AGPGVSDLTSIDRTGDKTSTPERYEDKSTMGLDGGYRGRAGVFDRPGRRSRRRKKRPGQLARAGLGDERIHHAIEEGRNGHCAGGSQRQETQAGRARQMGEDSTAP